MKCEKKKYVKSERTRAPNFDSSAPTFRILLGLPFNQNDSISCFWCSFEKCSLVYVCARCGSQSQKVDDTCSPGDSSVGRSARSHFILCLRWLWWNDTGKKRNFLLPRPLHTFFFFKFIFNEQKRILPFQPKEPVKLSRNTTAGEENNKERCRRSSKRTFSARQKMASLRLLVLKNPTWQWVVTWHRIYWHRQVKKDSFPDAKSLPILSLPSNRVCETQSWHFLAFTHPRLAWNLQKRNNAKWKMENHDKVRKESEFRKYQMPWIDNCV